MAWPNFFLILFSLLLKDLNFFFIISYHCSWMLCRVAAVKSLPHPSLVHIIFYFWSFEIMEYILRTRILSYVKIHFLNKFEIFWYFSTYQSLRRLPLLKFANSQYFSSGSFCQIYMVTDEALIAETMVWPNFFRINEFFALKGSNFFIIITSSPGGVHG